MPQVSVKAFFLDDPNWPTPEPPPPTEFYPAGHVYGFTKHAAGFQKFVFVLGLMLEGLLGW